MPEESERGPVRHELDRVTARLAAAERRLVLAQRQAAEHEARAAELGGWHHERTVERDQARAEAAQWRVQLERTQQARSLRLARTVRRLVRREVVAPAVAVVPAAATVPAAPAPVPEPAAPDVEGEAARMDAGLRSLLPDDAELAHQRAHPIAGPTLSIVVAVRRPRPAHLDGLLDSVLAQTHAPADLVLVDAANDDPAVLAALDRAEAAGATVVRLAADGGAATVTNAGLAACRGAHVAVVGHEDVLVPSALWRVAQVLAADPDVDVVYTDHDRIDDGGRLLLPGLKPGWSPELLRGAMYVGRLVVVRAALVREVGGFDPAFDGIEDFELLLRVAERRPRVVHVDRVLHHWRLAERGAAHGEDVDRDIDALQRRAVAAHLDRLGHDAEVRTIAPHRVVRAPGPGAALPSVSIVLPTKDAAELLDACLLSLFERTAYPDLEVVLVDTGTTDVAALEVQRSYPVALVAQPGPFNFSAACNAGAAAATGAVLVFLNNDIEILDPNWVRQLVQHLAEPDVGAVGATLLYADGSVQHAGVLLGMWGTVDHVGRGGSPDVETWPGFPICAREVSAVTGACLAIRADTFRAIGGFDADFGVIYQDVDLCLRLRHEGFRLVQSPARLLHHESRSRGSGGDELDRLLFLDRWEGYLAADPYFHALFDTFRGEHVPRWMAEGGA